MTNADVPLLALSGIESSPKNPWTGRALASDKADGVLIATIGALSTYRHSKYAYNIRRDNWLFVQGDIFNEASWRRGK
jgi:hypothetical protein